MLSLQTWTDMKRNSEKSQCELSKALFGCASSVEIVH